MGKLRQFIADSEEKINKAVERRSGTMKAKGIKPAQLRSEKVLRAMRFNNITIKITKK